MKRPVVRPVTAPPLTPIGVALLMAFAGYLQSAAALQGAQPRPDAQANVTNADVDVLPIRGNVYMLVGAGGNVTLHLGDDGVLLVDTGSASMSDKVIAAIRELTDKPIRWIVNTHVDADHTGGNAEVAKTGRSLPNGNAQGRLFAELEFAAKIVAHDNVMKRMSAPTGEEAPVASANWPALTYLTDDKELFFNGEPIQIMHQPAAHTDGDSVVFFRRTDVVAAGDVFVTTTYPVVDVARGGTIDGVIDALNALIRITIPGEKQEGGTYVVPGHGRLSDEADVVELRDMTTIVRDRIETMIKDGMTLEQVRAAEPTLDYDGRYGATTGAWTTDMFVEAVYRTAGRRN